MKYTHLMLSGGGTYGYIYIGIYRFLKEFDLLKHIKYLYGTSIGSFFAFLYGLDLDYEHMESLFTTPNQYCCATEVTTFDPNDLFHVYTKLGAYPIQQITLPLIRILEEKYQLSDITFCEYIKRTGKDLHINAVCINTGESIDFCNEKYPDMSILTAINASMCLPFIFQPIVYKDKLYIDGGTSNNLPLHIIPSLPAHKCLAVNLTIEMEQHTKELQSNFILYFLNVFYTVLKSATILELEKNKENDVININVSKIPINPLHFTKIKEKYIFDYPKDIIDKAILHGYEKLYYFYTSKYSSLQS